ncbi:MAG: hypothetical protein Q8M01_06350 [Rubrivivax sp.]|nr:hypothetical protein [Rubrivivax sp.]
MTINSMPARLAITALSLTATAAWAAEFGTVVSTTPVVAYIPVAQRQCSDEPVVYQQRPTGAGALIGAIAGAAIGSNIGSGAGRAVATGIGMVAGATVGDRVEADASSPVTSTVQRCRNLTAYERRTVGYDVVYDYQGVRRTARVAQDPGDQIALAVVVAPVGAMTPSSVITQAYAEPPAEVVDVQEPPRAIYTQPRYYDYGPPAYASPWVPLAVGIGIGIGWQGNPSWGRHGRWHGRGR